MVVVSNCESVGTGGDRVPVDVVTLLRFLENDNAAKLLVVDALRDDGLAQWWYKQDFPISPREDFIGRRESLTCCSLTKAVEIYRSEYVPWLHRKKEMTFLGKP
jgi:hypothetical protein